LEFGGGGGGGFCEFFFLVLLFCLPFLLIGDAFAVFCWTLERLFLSFLLFSLLLFLFFVVVFVLDWAA
jgi:hypothetical protein